MNVLIKNLAQSEGAIVADLFAAFPNTIPGDLPRYFADDVHPNDQGYALIAQAFLKALATSRTGQPGPTASAGTGPGGFAPLLPGTAADARQVFGPPPSRPALRGRTGPAASRRSAPPD